MAQHPKIRPVLPCVVLCSVVEFLRALSDTIRRLGKGDLAESLHVARCMFARCMSYVACCTQVRVPRRVAASDESGDTASRSSFCAAVVFEPKQTASQSVQCFGLAKLSGRTGPAACGTTYAAVCRPTVRLNHCTTPLSMLQTRSRTCTHDTVVHVFKVGTAHCAPAPLAVSGFAFGRSLRRPVIPTYRCNADRPTVCSLTAAGSQHRPRVCVRV